MFKHLLVPLDGSRLAEASLPVAALLARKLDAQVTLVHVVERDAPQEIHGDRHLSDPDEAAAYLDEAATRAFPAGVVVERHIHTNEVQDVALSIVEHVDELAPDLIVMCTHGRGGLRGWLWGSIAQQVIALGDTPVLLVHPDGAEAAPKFACSCLLVPLDGDPDHAQGLAVAASLARVCEARLHLLMVIPTLSTLQGQDSAAGRLLPGAMAAMLDMSEESGGEYLRQQVAQLQAQGLSVRAEVCRGDPAAGIVRTAQETKADLVVLGTHGKTGLDAFWSGSVAYEVASRSHLPLLLVPVRESAAAR
jgi:nucleotide-binding universal stress UspA family protein